jgi:adenylyltransferase/sulfurtransferase
MRLDETNAPGLMKDYDVIVDATDNYETRYIISDACIILGKPMVHGAIYMHEGQVSVFNYKDGPSYRCYHPGKILKKESYKNPRPADVGLMGVLPGITGTIMANEVLKIITGNGSVLVGRILIFNISDNTFRTIRINKNPENFDIQSIQARFPDYQKTL